MNDRWMHDSVDDRWMNDRRIHGSVDDGVDDGLMMGE